MEYKAKVNLNASGVKMNAGDLYGGPAELIEKLLAQGLIEVSDSPSDLSSDEKPKKKRKKSQELEAT